MPLIRNNVTVGLFFSLAFATSGDTNHTDVQYEPRRIQAGVARTCVEDRSTMGDQNGGTALVCSEVGRVAAGLDMPAPTVAHPFVKPCRQAVDLPASHDIVPAHPATHASRAPTGLQHAMSGMPAAKPFRRLQLSGWNSAGAACRSRVILTSSGKAAKPRVFTAQPDRDGCQTSHGPRRVSQGRTGFEN